MRIANKAQFYRLFDAGLLGNRLPALALAELDPEQTYSIRVKQAGGRTLYGIRGRDVPQAAAVCLGEVVITPTAPDDRLTIQGEIMRDHHQLRLFYATDPLPMKPALRKSGREVRGLAAESFLRTYCRPASYDMLMELLDAYDDAIVEFSAYRGGVGADPTHNVLIWEVRSDY